MLPTHRRDETATDACLTGNFIATLPPSVRTQFDERVRKLAGMQVVHSHESFGAACTASVYGVDTVAVFDALGVAVVPGSDLAKVRALHRAGFRLEQERGLYALGAYEDCDWMTWGLQALNMRDSVNDCEGSGVSIAVLDTGLDLTHHDRLDEAVQWTAVSFVPGEHATDGHGHGTHCAGTAAGPWCPHRTDIAYGVGYGARVMAGKVLSDQGYGRDSWILAGIEWAVRSGVAVISMSLGADVSRGTPHSAVYEAAAKAALDAGTLIVAAAGNSGDAVGMPANCPSVMAVAALAPTLQRAPFSSVGYDADERGQRHKGPDIAAPGVGVFSSVPLGTHSTGYASWSGTSMATPHVAGAAALWAAKTGARGRELWRLLVNNTRRLGDQHVLHVGAGLVQVPT